MIRLKNYASKENKNIFIKLFFIKKLKEICPRCQKALNYELWAETNSSGTDLNISHSVRYTPEWEPFFIASRTSPSYDERINSEGFDRLFHVKNSKIFLITVIRKNFVITEFKIIKIFLSFLNIIFRKNWSMQGKKCLLIINGYN